MAAQADGGGVRRERKRRKEKQEKSELDVIPPPRPARLTSGLNNGIVVLYRLQSIRNKTMNPHSPTPPPLPGRDLIIAL